MVGVRGEVGLGLVRGQGEGSLGVVGGLEVGVWQIGGQG